MAASSRTSSRAAGSSAGGLSLSPDAERVQLLRRERARLLREIQKKRLQLDRVREQARGDAERATAEMRPLVIRHAALVRDLHQLFSELLQEGRLDRRERKEILSLRRHLELEGVLAPLADEEVEPEAGPVAEPEPERRRARAQKGPPGRPELESAAPRGQERRSIRELFRNLARAIHPDQARHEAERQHRTDLMKQVTRAYQDGDLARLLELERAWASERAASSGGALEPSAGDLERINRELLAQVRLLTREIRDAKAQARAASDGLPPEALLEQACAELDELAAICEFLRRFRDRLAGAADLSGAPRPRRRRGR